ncbi:MAG: biopolymer transporter ExbD [Desulfuromonas sp.]|nr:MAG: biopolymer transporter ExbD [Desulfuromonas sp.]
MLKRRSRRRFKETPELNITTFLNLMVVLIPFLLISAVFSRVTILELSVPTAASTNVAVDKPEMSVEVIVRQEKLEFSNGSKVVATIPKKDGEYDLKKLSSLLLRIKSDYPQKEDAMVLMEPDIKYDYLIQIMDAVRGARAWEEDSEDSVPVPLFPDISIGDAP